MITGPTKVELMRMLIIAYKTSLGICIKRSCKMSFPEISNEMISLSASYV